MSLSKSLPSKGILVPPGTGGFRVSSIAGHIVMYYVRQFSQFLKLISYTSFWSFHESQRFPHLSGGAHIQPPDLETECRKFFLCGSKVKSIPFKLFK